MLDHGFRFVLLTCLCLSACGGDGRGAGDSANTIGHEGSGNGSEIESHIDLVALDLAGTPRAKPAATMGALEVL